MMKAILVILLISTFAQADPATHLELSATALVHQGDSIDCLLKLEGSAVESLVNSTPGFIHTDSKYPFAGGFVYPFAVRAEKIGDLVLGPYSVEFQGQKYVSNRLKISVQPKQGSPGTAKARLTLGSSRLKLGESVGLELVYPTKDPKEQLPILVFARELDARGRAHSTTMSMINGRLVTVQSETFQLTPQKKGSFVLSKQTIQGFPDIDIEPQTLVVE